MAFFKFRAGGPANEGRNASVPPAPAESVEAMRRRARHRLLGAAVLVLLGVIGFPLLFDTQPRPIAVDIPIEIPDRAKSKPLVVPPVPQVAAQAPAPSSSGAASVAGTAGSRVAEAPSSGGMITERADGSEVLPDKPATSAPAPAPAPAPQPEKPEKPEHRTETKPVETKPVETKPAVTSPAPAKPAVPDDGARARALLEGKPATAAAAAAKPAAASEEGGRFVVQVGAFADADKAREVRQKLERAGLKTYTNVAKTADGERTRVRVGPFGSRAEADRAASRVKGLSLPASVLTL